MQGFLQQADVAAYYERAGDAAEIIGKIAYQATDLDSIVTFTPQGAWYRFTGGISNAACRQLWAAHKQGTLAAYAVIELDGVWFFCHAAPVYTDTAAKPVGTVVLLDTLQKTLRALEGNVSGIDTAVILDDTILLSDNPALEGQNAQTLVGQYGEVTMSQVSGTNLSVAAAVTKEALNTGGRTFVAVSAALLVFLALAIALLYRFLSSRMIVPLLTKAEKMQMGLLTTQIDAHFVVNTITTIQILSEKGESDRAARLSGGLAALIKCQHQAGDSVNIFMELEMLEQYAEVMNARRENRYNVDFEVDDRLAACRMPGQVLQPVVENAIAGDASLFARADEIELSWQIIDPIQASWEQAPQPDSGEWRAVVAPPLEFYEEGTWGPLGAEQLLARTGRQAARPGGAVIPISARGAVQRKKWRRQECRSKRGRNPAACGWFTRFHPAPPLPAAGTRQGGAFTVSGKIRTDNRKPSSATVAPIIPFSFPCQWRIGGGATRRTALWTCATSICRWRSPRCDTGRRGSRARQRRRPG